MSRSTELLSFGSSRVVPAWGRDDAGGEPVIVKNLPSAFVGTDLEAQLASIRDLFGVIAETPGDILD